MTTVANTRSPLLPNRHPEPDFFVCDIFNAAPKGDMASMEHPIFSLSTKPDRKTRRYEHGDTFVEIKPSADGLATVHDRDIIIYCISQVMAAMKAGQPVSQIIRFRAHDLLKATNRMTNGSGYDGLKAALERLAGTRIATNIITGGKEVHDNFGLIDQFRLVRQTREGRMQEVEVRLSDWVFNALEKKEVLTLHPNYFRLRKSIERRLYELARKHCGRQAEWRVSLSLLQKKCGAESSPREFRRLVGKIVDEDRRHNHFPDYAIEHDADDMIVFRNRRTIPKLASEDAELVLNISEDGYEEARAVAPGWDIHFIKREWKHWAMEQPRDVDAAFVGFCRKWYERRGRPS